MFIILLLKTTSTIIYNISGQIFVQEHKTNNKNIIKKGKKL